MLITWLGVVPRKYHGECLENSMENLHADVRVYRLNNQLYLNDPVLSYSFGIKVLLKCFIELEYYIVCSQFTCRKKGFHRPRFNGFIKPSLSIILCNRNLLWNVLRRHNMFHCITRGGSRGKAGGPPPPLTLFWVKIKKESQKEEKPAGQATNNRVPPPLSSRSGSATDYYHGKFI